MSSSREAEARGFAPSKIEAIVGSVLGSGSRRFAVTYPRAAQSGVTENTSITFSLADWNGIGEPRKGQVVILEEVQRFARGWRALRARPIPLGQQPASRKE